MVGCWRWGVAVTRRGRDLGPTEGWALPVRFEGRGLWMGGWRWGVGARWGEIWDRRSRVPPGGWVRRGDSLRREAFYKIS